MWKLELKNKINEFCKYKNFENPFIENFVRKQLDVLPPTGNQEENDISTLNSRRNDLINELSNNGNLRKKHKFKRDP